MAKGWLSKYDVNVNDSKVTIPDGFVGMGNDTTGRNYSPTWGGQFQNGGNIPIPYNYLPNAKSRTFLQPTSPKLPSALNNVRNPWIQESSSELASSIGGENGEPAYMIPTFKYGKPLTDPIQEFRKTGEHLGGPFKTYQEAEKYEKIRHQYMGREMPSPIRTRSYRNGGEIMNVASPEFPIAKNGISQQNDKNGSQLGQLTDFSNKPNKNNWLQKYK